MEDSDHWGFRRSAILRPRTVPTFESLTVTHPFHPLAGQRVAILFERTYRYLPLGRVYVCDGGTLGNALPGCFTDRGAPAAARPLTWRSDGTTRSSMATNELVRAPDDWEEPLPVPDALPRKHSRLPRASHAVGPIRRLPPAARRRDKLR